MRLAWLDAQWNVPSRTDNYLMQIAAYLSAMPKLLFSKRGIRIDLKRFFIKFASRKNAELESEQITKQAKSVWIARTGYEEGPDGDLVKRGDRKRN